MTCLVWKRTRRALGVSPRRFRRRRAQPKRQRLSSTRRDKPLGSAIRSRACGLLSSALKPSRSAGASRVPGWLVWMCARPDKSAGCSSNSGLSATSLVNPPWPSGSAWSVSLNKYAARVDFCHRDGKAQMNTDRRRRTQTSSSRLPTQDQNEGSSCRSGRDEQADQVTPSRKLALTPALRLQPGNNFELHRDRRWQGVHLDCGPRSADFCEMFGIDGVERLKVALHVN